MKIKNFMITLFIVMAFITIPTLTSLTLNIFAVTTLLETEVKVYPNDVINDDLYIAGQLVSISGEVKGDLLTAAGSFVLDGTILGDLFVLGRSVSVLSSGRVEESVRLAGEKVSVQGSIGQDLIMVGSQVMLEYGVPVGGDVLVIAQKAFVAGNVLGKVKVYASEVEILGSIGKDLEITAEKITIFPGTIVEGKFNYSSPEQAITTGSLIKGGIFWNKKAVRFLEEFKSFRVHPVWSFLIGYLALFMTGIFSFLLFPGRVKQIQEKIQKNIWFCLGLGLLFIILTPIAAVLFFVTLVGTPVGIFALFIYLSVLYVSRVYAGLFLGDRIINLLIRKNVHPLISMALGLLILLLLSKVNYVGWLITLIAILVGSGSMAKVFLESYSKFR